MAPCLGFLSTASDIDYATTTLEDLAAAVPGVAALAIPRQAPDWNQSLRSPPVKRDRGSDMASQARDAMGKAKLAAIADRGYFSGPQVKACEDVGITAHVPKPMTSSSKAAGRFSKADFIYIRRDDLGMGRTMNAMKLVGG